MGLHQDRDDAEMAAPVVSISLGDDAVFRLGGTTRGGPARSLKLASGDVLVLGGAARLAFHGIDRVLGGSSRLPPGGCRVNLNMRRVARLKQQPPHPPPVRAGTGTEPRCHRRWARTEAQRYAGKGHA